LYNKDWNIIEKQEPIYLKERSKISTIENIGSSSRMEGVSLTDKEIKEVPKNVNRT